MSAAAAAAAADASVDAAMSVAARFRVRIYDVLRTRRSPICRLRHQLALDNAAISLPRGQRWLLQLKKLLCLH